jgi:hypothetical protein
MAGDEVTILLHCRNLPGNRFESHTAVRLGVQRGRDVVDDVPGDVADVTFTIPLRVTRNAKNGRPNFLGPFAQGNSDDRFIYLSWGERHGGTWEMFRRAKIKLDHLSWENVEQVLRHGEPIEAQLSMTDRSGGPLCATVREHYIAWKL